MQVLCDIRNFKYLIQNNKSMIENFFNLSYVCLSRGDTICNFNHLAKICEYFFRKEPGLCINFIIHYNFPFRLIQNAEFEYVHHLLLILFNCSEQSLDIGEVPFN